MMAAAQGVVMIDGKCDGDFVKVRYAGPTGRHLVYSPLKKVANYGMHTTGDLLCVHPDDQRTVPTIFVLVVEEAPVEKPVAAPEPEPEPEPEPAPEEVAEPPKPKSKRQKEEKGDVL